MSVAVTRRRRLSRRHSLRRGAAVLVLLAVVAGWWTFLRPSSLGGPLTIVTVSGHSMEPRFFTGDLVLVREANHYEKGDVIAFRAEVVPGRPGAYVVHRIVGGDPRSGFVTRGDNNTWDDMWHPTADTVTGKLLFSVPEAGMWVHWLARPVHLGAVLAGLTACLTAFGPREAKSRKAERVTHKAEVPS